MDSKEVIRVVGCQGSIQFITAVNVLRHEQSKGARRNFLLIYELHAPNGQDEDFFRFIKKMAEQAVVPFEKIIYITPDMVKDLSELFVQQGVHPLTKRMLNILGVNEVDEIYLSTNWQSVNKLLLNCFERSHKVCYGDSIGLHIPEYYFSDQDLMSWIRQSAIVNFFRQIRRSLKFPGRRPVFGGLRKINFDRGYYLTTGLVNKKPAWSCHYTRRSILVDTFQKYTDLFSFEGLNDLANGNRTTAILMTTNFSEARRMTLENELEAYLQFIQTHLPANSSLIIKPHPRDSKTKLDQLKKILLENSYQVRILDDINYYFVPFELFLLKIRTTYPQRLQHLHYVTFSSACLSIKLLFGEDPHVGMGPDLVKKYFNPSHQASRIKHENDLKRLLTIEIKE